MRKTKKQTRHQAVLVEEKFYHIFNRTNNKEILFLNDQDRLEFLKKIRKFLSPYVDIYCYCLLGNHFHLMVRVKTLEEIVNFVSFIPQAKQSGTQIKFLETKDYLRQLNELLINQFSRFFTSYSMYFNIKHTRAGNLFHRRFKRVLVESETHFSMLIYYIHTNPRKHKVFENYKNYKWSSYQSMLSTQPTNLFRKEVLDWFGGKDEFIKFHDGYPDLNNIDDLIIE